MFQITILENKEENRNQMQNYLIIDIYCSLIYSSTV